MKIKRKGSISRKAAFSVAFMLFVLYTLLILFFFAYGILLSVKASQVDVNNDIANATLFSLPKNFSLINYVKCFTDWERYTGYSYWIMVWNSIWRTVLSAFLSWFSTALVCYVLVHYKSKFTECSYIGSGC